ncbi:MAG: hypothetical protein GXP54_00635 [Deltaproteobacteria bacterium]|nr:hypothetical protein [Deltaproteobacteria bacterium]
MYLVRDNTARRLSVSPSIREGGWVAVDADLKEGDMVVVGNLDAIKDGMTVYPVSMEKETP